MTEDRELPSADETWAEPSDVEQVRTGVASVDAVIAAVDDLQDRPVEEHVAVFESAHEHLRRALDDQPVRPGTS